MNTLAIAPVALGTAIAFCAFVFCSIIAVQMVMNFFKWLTIPEKENHGPKGSPEQTANNKVNGMRRYQSNSRVPTSANSVSSGSMPPRAASVAPRSPDAVSLYRLGRLYETGQDEAHAHIAASRSNDEIPSFDAPDECEIYDFVSAHCYYNLAASKGHPDAAAARDNIAQAMPPEQIAKAQAMARQWLKDHPVK